MRPHGLPQSLVCVRRHQRSRERPLPARRHRSQKTRRHERPNEVTRALLERHRASRLKAPTVGVPTLPYLPTNSHSWGLTGTVGTRVEAMTEITHKLTRRRAGLEDGASNDSPRAGAFAKRPPSRMSDGAAAIGRTRQTPLFQPSRAATGSTCSSVEATSHSTTSATGRAPS